jgi:hypothetical protein
MLQHNGRIVPSIKQLIMSGLIKSLKFAIFGSGGRLFYFKGSICVKKLVRSLPFCPKVPLLNKNQANIYCSK